MYFCVVLCIVCFVPFSVLFVCICVLNYYHRVATQFRLTNIISYHIPYHEFLPDVRRHISETGSVHCHHCEYVQSYGLKLGLCSVVPWELMVQYTIREDAEKYLNGVQFYYQLYALI